MGVKTSLIIFVLTFWTVAETTVTDGELSTFMQSIWNSDVNAATDVRVSLQSHTSTYSNTDRASNMFFSYVNDQATLSKPTYTALLRLLNNYNHVIGHEELYTHTEELEISNFLHAVSNTSVMQQTLAFLSREGYCSSSWSSLEQKLRQIWFATYPRHGHTYDSSGFEHVFVGETDSTEVVGFHNWVQFHIQERERKLNYLGYVFSKQPNTVGTHFKWNGKVKKLGSLMYGTSPEFDMAMFTVCFYARRNKPCSFHINGHVVEVVTYDTSHGGGNHIGTAYVS